MKKFMLIGFLFLAGSAVFCQQVTTALTSEQEKRVSGVNDNAKDQLKTLVKNDKMAPEDKKTNVQSIKSGRDAQLAGFLTTEQVALVLQKDPVNWDDASKDIEKQTADKKKDDDKQAAKQQKAEKEQKLSDLDKQSETLSTQQSDLEKQSNELKKKQDDLKSQQKTLETQRDQVKKQYK